jgi:threonine/homoserine/homoserine lactone efflux protein
VNGLGALRAAGLGLGLGVVTGMPIAVINVAIVDAVTAGRRRFAAGLALGGAAADTIHAMLAFAGVGRVMIADPALVRGLAIAAAATIVGYVVVTWRRRARAVEARPAPQPTPQPNADAPPVRGLATGFLLTLPNPGALAAWVAVAAAVWPDAAPAEAAVIAGGVGAGSALWFTLLARWIGRVRRDHPVLAWVPRAAAILLVAIAAAGVARAL